MKPNLTNPLLNLFLMFSIAFFGLLGIVLFNFQNFALIAYFLVTIYFLFNLRKAPEDIWIVISAFFIGVIADITISYFGGWKFSNNAFFGVPPWLAFSWSWNALLFKKIGKELSFLMRF